jgi:hypothetical protein
MNANLLAGAPSVQIPLPDSLYGRIEALLHDGRRNADVYHELQTFQVHLEAMPLPTDEFALARCRLDNARRYLQYNERGAAQYELRLMMRGLRGSNSRVC